MDISSLNIPETVRVHIEFPGSGKLYADDAKTQPVVIEMYGPSTDQFLQEKRRAARVFRNAAMKKGKVDDIDPIEEEVKRLCNLTASVSGLTYKGEIISRDTVVKVYRDPKMGWLKEQVAERIAGWDSFLDS